MPSRPGKQRHVPRCAVCDGQFGLVRHHRWRTPLCSKKCVDRFRTRWENDWSWLSWFQITVDALPDKWRGTASANMNQQILGDSRSRAGDFLSTSGSLRRV